MKNCIISCVIFISMILGIIFCLNYLNQISAEIFSLNSVIEEHIVDEKWDLAYKASMSLLDTWNENSVFISIFTNDNDLHSVSDEIVKLTQYIRCKNKDDSLVSVHSVKYFMNHIKDLQKLNVENIF